MKGCGKLTIGASAVEISAGCDRIGIFTNNGDRSAQFYTEKMGFEKEKEEILPESLMNSLFGVPSPAPSDA
jgi:catechol 2,3-dioxygenase-like lactoylglutathione lyase family enzyme